MGAFCDGEQLFVPTVFISDGNFPDKRGDVNYMKINKDYNASARNEETTLDAGDDGRNGCVSFVICVKQRA